MLQGQRRTAEHIASESPVDDLAIAMQDGFEVGKRTRDRADVRLVDERILPSATGGLLVCSTLVTIVHDQVERHQIPLRSRRRRSRISARTCA